MDKTTELYAYEAELRDAQAELLTVRRRVDGLEMIVTGLRHLANLEAVAPDDGASTDLPSEIESDGPEAPRPKGSDAIRQLLAEQPEREWKIADVIAELERRGWMSTEAQHPQAATRAAMQRLVNRFYEVERTAHGTYRLRRDVLPPGGHPLTPLSGDRL